MAKLSTCVLFRARRHHRSLPTMAGWALGICLAAATFTSSGQPASWPERPITLIVPYTVGGQFDTIARMLAERMSAKLGANVIVENKPGASTIIGADFVARAANDGYTLLYAGTNTFSILPHLYNNLPYKNEDFQPISLVTEVPMGVMISAQVPVKTLPEFIAYAKQHPTALNFGSSGEAGAQRLLCELLKQHAGIEMQHIAYKGTVQILQDLIPGRISVACDALLAYLPPAKSEQLRIVAVTSNERLPGIPDVPTLSEQGYPEAAVSAWAGILAPAGIPKDILDKLHAVTVEAASAPEVRERIENYAAIPRTSTPEEFRNVIESDLNTWGGVIKTLGIAAKSL